MKEGPNLPWFWMLAVAWAYFFILAWLTHVGLMP
jgi:hypothetical protein